MTFYIQHLDQIAREEGRDVIGIIFINKETRRSNAYKSWPERNDLIAWFEENGITAYPCTEIADECCMTAYQGQLYIDVPVDETNPDYIKIQKHLKNPDGTMRNPDVILCHLPLDVSMANKHHDEPGFWDEWAKTY